MLDQFSVGHDDQVAFQSVLELLILLLPFVLGLIPFELLLFDEKLEPQVLLFLLSLHL